MTSNHHLQTRMLCMGLLAAVLVAWPAAHTAADTMLLETFGGGSGTNLAGTAADIGGVWSGSTNFKKDGSTLDGSNTAYQGVTIAPGNIYTLMGDLSPSAGGTTDWLALGFTSIAGGGGNSLNSDGGTSYGWMLLRDNGQTQTFAGADTANLQVNNASIGNPSNVSVRLDTTNPLNYTVQFFNEGQALAGPVSIGAPSLTQAVISQFSMSGNFDNVLLNRQETTTSAGPLLLADDFTVSPPIFAGNNNLNANLVDGRQSGEYALTTYRRNNNAQVGNQGSGDKTVLDNGNVLLVADGAAAIIEQNFNNAVSHGGLLMKFDAAPDVRNGNVNSTNWLAAIIGLDPATTAPVVNGANTHFGILFRENGQFQAFDGSTAVGSGAFTINLLENQFYRDIRIFMTDATDGNPFDGTGQTDISVWFEGTEIFSYSKLAGGYVNNYIAFQGNQIAYLDNLSIVRIPEPSSYALGLIGMAALAVLRFRRGRSGT